MRRTVPWLTIGVAVAMTLACGEPQSLVNLDVTADQRYQPATLRIEAAGITKVFVRVTLDPSTPLRIAIYLPGSVGGAVHVTGELGDAGCVLGRGSADVMNVKAGGSVGPVTLPIHATAGCDADGGGTDAEVGTGGAGNGGSGGSPGIGGAGAGGLPGAGGAGSGGSGAGGNGGGGTGAGGIGAATGGGSGSGGSVGTGGAGAGGRPGTGGAPGSGGSGSGGRPGTGGARGSGGTSGTCVAAIRDSGYAAGGQSCAACLDNGRSLEVQCKAVIDCLVPLWPCTGTCLTNCLNQVGGPSTLGTCVMALTDAACNGAGAGPCAGLCVDPIVFTTTTYLSSDLGTAATCHETTAALAGVICSNFTPPRTFSANGKVLDCSGPGAPPPKRNGGYCFQASAGNPSYSSFTTY